METLATALKTETYTINGAGAFLWLFEIVRDSSNTSYYVRNTENVDFNSQTYTAKEISFDPPKYDAGATLSDWLVTIGNADRVEIAYLEAAKYRAQRITIRLVNANQLDSASNQVIFRGMIKYATASETAVTLHCGSNDFRHCVVPRSTLHALRCRWRFKSTECGYSGGQSACDLTYTTCLNTMANQERFGGAPGMPKFNP